MRNVEEQKFQCRCVIKRKWKKIIKKIHSNFDIVFQTIASITISASSVMCKYIDSLMSTHQKWNHSCHFNSPILAVKMWRYLLGCDDPLFLSTSLKEKCHFLSSECPDCWREMSAPLNDSNFHVLLLTLEFHVSS